MSKTEPTEYTGKPITGYAILAVLSPRTRVEIANLINEISAQLPNVLWQMPPEQLHITLLEIIQPKPYKEDKEKLYKMHQLQYEGVPEQVLSVLPKIKVKFDVIEASSAAIIVRTSDPSGFNSLRTQLVQNMQLPAETRTPPDIIHSTIARYTDEIDLEKVQKVVERHKISIEEEITEFVLIKNEVPPLEKYQVLKTFALK